MQIPPPENAPLNPDPYTKKGLEDDQTGPAAKRRVLYINVGVLRFGTSDRVLAVSFIFSFLLFCVIVALLISGPGQNKEWSEKALNWATGTFLFSLGVALGKSDSGEVNGKQD